MRLYKMVTMADRADNLPIGEKELKILISNLGTKKGFRAMFFLILGTGMNLDDCLGIKLQDINYAQNQIMVLDRGLARMRCVKLNPSIVKALTEYQDGRLNPTEHLFPISNQTAITTLYDLSQTRIGKPISWIAVRRTWAILCFRAGIGLKDMMESSGASADQLAVWSRWEKGNGGKKDPPDLLAGLLK